MRSAPASWSPRPGRLPHRSQRGAHTGAVRTRAPLLLMALRYSRGLCGVRIPASSERPLCALGCAGMRRRTDATGRLPPRCHPPSIRPEAALRRSQVLLAPSFCLSTQQGRRERCSRRSGSSGGGGGGGGGGEKKKGRGGGGPFPPPKRGGGGGGGGCGP